MPETKNVETLPINSNSAYEETYRMRIQGGGISTSISKKVVERKARELGITVTEFIRDYEVVVLYDSFKDKSDKPIAFVGNFRKKDNENKVTKEEKEWIA